MDCSPPDSSVHGVFQARILEWVSIPFSRRSSQPRDQTQVSCIADRVFIVWATRESLLQFVLSSTSLNSIRGFPGGPVGKESSCNERYPGSIPGSGRSNGEGNGNPLHYSCLKNPMDRGVWQGIVCGVTRVGHDLVTKPQQWSSYGNFLMVQWLPVKGDWVPSMVKELDPTCHN